MPKLQPKAAPVTSAVCRSLRQGLSSSRRKSSAIADSMPKAATVRMAATASAAVWLATSADLFTYGK